MRRLLLLFFIIVLISNAYAEDRALVLKKMKNEKRVALIIGNSAYDNSPLKNPVNDAKLMNETLKKLGFETIVKTNADYAGMMQAIDQFGISIRGGGVGLFYYAGHGIQIDGANYLVPLNSGIQSEPEVKYRAINSGLVMAKMESAGNRMNIMILDACRNNPFERSFRSSEKGLATMDAPTGSFIAYAMETRKMSRDGSGNNGLFTEKFVEALKTPNLTIEQVFKNTRALVMNNTNKTQVPFTSSSIVGDFYFNLSGGAERYTVDVPDVKMPSGGGFSLDDLQQKDKELAEKEKQAKLAWDNRLTGMSSAFNKVKNYETSTKINGNKVVAWKKFKNSFNDDNPYTTKDEEMRSYADKRISALENQVAMTKKVEPKNSSGSGKFKVLKTGQTRSYVDGDDGYYKLGKERKYTRNNEIVTDHSTGLMWQDDSGAKDREYTWNNAIQYCKNLSLGGYSDWRLPAIKELKTIVDLSKYKPSIDNMFQNVNSSNYWSSTPYAGFANNAWNVLFYVGNDNNYSKSYASYARCVRGGQ